MKYSTSGITTTRPIVTRFGALVISRRRLDGATVSSLNLRCVEQDDALALADDLERRRLPVRATRERRAVRNQASDPADQARARQQRRALLGHLDRDGRLAQRQRDDPAAAELQHPQVG